MRRSNLLTCLLALGVLALSAIATTMVVSASPNDQPRTVDIDLAEWSINPKVVTVPAGTAIRFNLKNGGQFPHNLEISGNGIAVKSPNVPGGQTQVWEQTIARPGAYAIWCSVGNGRHLERGMWGTLMVVGADGRLPAFSLPQRAPEPAAAGPAPAGAQTVNLSLVDWDFNPKVVTVTAGVPVRFVMANTGRFPHYAEIGGMGVNAASGNVISQTTGVWDYTFAQPGGYILWCPVGNGTHLMRGMHLTVYVNPPAGQAPAAAGQPAAQPSPIAQMPAALPRSGEATTPLGLIALSAVGLATLLAGLWLARR